jgi:hypothetical protein
VSKNTPVHLDPVVPFLLVLAGFLCGLLLGAQGVAAVNMVCVAPAAPLVLPAAGNPRAPDGQPSYRLDPVETAP